MSERDISPQRMVHYRSTWYVDAWCHTRERLLRFALYAIDHATALDVKAKEVSLKQVEAALDGRYGSYAGAKRAWATLLFQPPAAQWVSREEWHPSQQASWRPDGRYQLKVPFNEATELIMELLRQEEFVEINAPESLRIASQLRLKSAANQYEK